MAELIKTLTPTYTLTLTEDEIEVIRESLVGDDLNSNQVRISDELLTLIGKVLDNGI